MESLSEAAVTNFRTEEGDICVCDSVRETSVIALCKILRQVRELMYSSFDS